MSELVEKTARAMCADAGFDPEQVMPNDGPRWKYYEPQARAAIAAVAEWLAQSEDRECNPLQALAAALRAAGDGR